MHEHEDVMFIYMLRYMFVGGGGGSRIAGVYHFNIDDHSSIQIGVDLFIFMYNTQVHDTTLIMYTNRNLNIS
jgi:hypothetical protein